jgi:hypothetical protein
LRSPVGEAGWSDRVRRLAGWLNAVLRSLELERAERIKATYAQAAPPAPAHRAADQDAPAGVPLRIRRTRGARWSQRRSTPLPDSSRFVGRSG